MPRIRRIVPAPTRQPRPRTSPWMRRCPGGVLPGQPADQLAGLLQDRRASGGVRVGPCVLDQAQVPGERSAGRHDPVQPQQPRQGGDHGPVSPGPLRAGNLAAQDPRAGVPSSPRPWRCCCARGALAKPNDPTIGSQTSRKRRREPLDIDEVAAAPDHVARTHRARSRPGWPGGQTRCARLRYE